MRSLTSNLPPVETAAPGRARSITLSAIAREAGVSVTAVSALFKGSYYGSGTATARTTVGIGPETRRKIIAASRQLGYQPVDPAWRINLYPEEGDICFLLPSGVVEGLANPYYARFANGAMERLHRAGRHLGFAFYSETLDYGRHPERLPAPILAHQVSRVLIAGDENRSLLAALAERDLRVAYLSRHVEAARALCLTPDYRAAARLATRHLHALGHRSIVCAGSDYMRNLRYACAELTRGWREAWGEAGLPGAAPEPLLAPPGAALWAALRELRPRPTAVYFFDDYAARTCVRAAIADGLRVPGDLSVVGTNNEIGTGAIEVPLTTINFPAEQIGEAAIEALSETEPAEGGPVARPRVFPVSLVERASSAPPSAPKPGSGDHPRP